MSISKKPIQNKTAVNENIVTALINKGGKVPDNMQATIENEKVPKKVLKGGQVPIQLRLSPEIVDVIDTLINDRLIPISRHAWFMNAISEQIKREKEG
jgi:hypothetical protein